MPSGGIGPHEILRLPGARLLAIANGGIHTRPDTGREKLNLDTMRPNLTLMDEDGDDEIDFEEFFDWWSGKSSFQMWIGS